MVFTMALIYNYCKIYNDFYSFSDLLEVSSLVSNGQYAGNRVYTFPVSMGNRSSKSICYKICK